MDTRLTFAERITTQIKFRGNIGEITSSYPYVHKWADATGTRNGRILVGPRPGGWAQSPAERPSRDGSEPTMPRFGRDRIDRYSTRVPNTVTYL